MGARWLAAGVLVALVIAACGTRTPSQSGSPAASTTAAGPSPGCPYLSSWSPYTTMGVPAGVTVRATGGASVRVANSTGHEWTARGELWQWMPCFGIAPTDGVPVSVPAGSSVLVTVPAWQDWGGTSETTPIRVAVALFDHACTAGTCEDRPSGFWWVEQPVPSPSLSR
jgi:hypothetical protein